MEKPFLELSNNVNRLKIKATGYDLSSYKHYLKNVFLRLHNYFEENNFYDFNDYNRLLDILIIKQDYFFSIDDKLPARIRGRFYKSNARESGLISLSRKDFYNMEDTEGCLCHEIIHLISTGMDFITYKDGNNLVEIVVPDNVGLKAGYKKTYFKNTTKTEILTFNELGKNNFLKEGLTELLKQQIYGKQEARPAYEVQTTFIEFLNFASGCSLKQAFKDFLQGDLVTYKKALTKAGYDSLYKELNLFLEEYEANEDLFSCEHYIKANGIVAGMALRQFEKTKPTMKQFVEYINILATKVVVFDKENFYENTVNSAVKIFNQNITRNRYATEKFKEEYAKLLSFKEQQIWYSYTSKSIKGFKLNGLSEEIYFLPDKNGHNVQANLGDTDLTPLLLPMQYGVTYSFGNSSSENKLLISRIEDNKYKYQQGSTQRIVTFDGYKCKVLDENGKVVDEGYISTYKNSTLKQAQYDDAVSHFNKFLDDCLLEKEENKLKNSNVENKDEQELKNTNAELEAEESNND